MPSPLGTYSSRGRLVLCLIVVLGFLLRIAYQIDRPFAGDELGTLRFLESDYGHLVSTFDQQLTMNYYFVVLKFLRATLGTSPWVLVAPGLLAGVLTIVLTARIALLVAGERLALASAFLVATNPCLIIFSCRIRSYMLLVGLTMGAVAGFLVWAENRDYRRGIGCALWSSAALLMHPNAVYQMGFMVVLAAFELRRRNARSWTLLVPMLVAALLVVTAYLPLRGDMAVFRAEWSHDAPTPWDYLPEALRIFLVGHGYMLPSLALFGGGLWVAAQGERRLALMGFGILVPMVMASCLGVSHYPWTYARFLMPVLPLLLIFIARGAGAVATRSKILHAALLVGLCISWSPRLTKDLEVRTEQPIATVAEHLGGLALPWHGIIAFDDNTRTQLFPFLQKRAFTNVREYSAKKSRAATSRLAVVCKGVRLRFGDDERWSSAAFGKIQVAVIEAPSREAALRGLFKALETTLSEGDIKPILTPYYEVLRGLAERFAPEREAEYVRLYFECFMRTRGQRYIPPQFRESSG